MLKPPIQPIALPRRRPPERLDSWKEIAAHLNRSIRTAQRWEQTEGLPVYRHGHDKRDSVYAFASEVDEWWASRRARLEEEPEQPRPPEGPIPLQPASRRGPRWISNPWLWAGAAAVLLGVAGWLWRQFSPSAVPLAFAPRDWVLVADFTNRTGEALFDDSLRTAFTVSLQQSKHVNVLPQPRILAALGRMGRPAEVRLDETAGRELCLRENARAMILCEISRSGQRYALSARLIDPRTGETVRGYLEQAASQDEIIPAVDRLARRLRGDLGESLASIRSTTGQSLPLVTTPSLQALSLYTQAGQLMRKGDYKEAAELYRASLDHDPDFAMAHAALGGLYVGQVFNDAARGKTHYERALQLSSRTSEREKLFIRASYAQALGSLEEALQLHAVYLKSYPDDTGARYRLGAVLMQNNRLEEAVGQFTELVRVAPTDAPGLVNLATSYDQLGVPDKALEAYQRAFALEPGWVVNGNLNHEYGFALVKAGDLAHARRVFEQAVRRPT
jgi:tetratricopeptide (TPR) repeat protein